LGVERDDSVFCVILKFTLLKKIVKYMLSKRGLAIFVGCLLVFLSIGYFSHGTNPNESRYDKILHSAGVILEKAHYSPKNIDDKFSSQVFDEFIDKLDPDKNIFLSTDIQQLAKYKTSIDNEILGDSVSFFYAAMKIYKQRISFLKGSFPALTGSPLDFTKDEMLIVNDKDEKFAADEQGQVDLWRKKIKYLALQKYSDLLDQRGKDTSLKNATDADLEIKGRQFASKIVNKYVDRELGKTSLDDYFSVFINTITNEMDPHTSFFMPVEKREWNEEITGKFYGIGAFIGEENGYVKISSVSQGGPAWKTGEINDGDLILKIGQGNEPQVDVVGWESTDAIKLIRGDKGTTVRLTVKKVDGSIKTVSIERQELKLDETFAKSSIIEKDGKKIGYIYLPKFYTNYDGNDGASCAKDVAAEITKLKAENIDGLIMDLRNNGGGSLYEVVQMVGLFVPQGPVVQVKGRQGPPSVIDDNINNSGVLYTGPLEVMVNEFSASASEIFTAAIQDYKRGIITGSSSTYGKGSVQSPIPINRVLSTNEDLGTIHLTIQKYYRINGSSVQLRGVTPDIVLPGYYEFYDVMERDNKTSLPWDELSKTNFTVSNSSSYLPGVISEVKKDDSLTVFDRIRQNSQWLAKENKEPVSLNLDKYRLHLKEVRTEVEETQKLLKLNKQLVIDNTTVDKNTLKDNKDKQQRNTQWLNILKQDVYLGEALNIAYKMVNNDKTVAVKN
jgi:carboxyl-terminal processing protease